MRLPLLFILISCLLLSMSSAQTETKLSVLQIDVDIHYVDRYDRISDKRETDDDVFDGEEIEADVYPESEVEFTVTIMNDFTDDEELAIEENTLQITIKDIDDGEDLEKESPKFDLDPQEEKEVVLVFNMPKRVEAKEYEVIVEIDGEDDNNTQHQLEQNIILKMIKDKHDIDFLSNTITPEVVECGESVTIESTVFNQGHRDQDEVSVRIRNSEIGLDFERQNIVINVDDEDAFDEDNFEAISFSHKIPEDTPEGTYNVLFKGFYEDVIELVSQSLPLQVQCAPPQEPEVEPEPEPEPEPTPEPEPEVDELPTIVEAPPEEPEQPVEPETQEVPVLQPTTSVEKKFTQSPLFIASIVVMNVIIVILVIIIIINLLKK